MSADVEVPSVGTKLCKAGVVRSDAHEEELESPPEDNLGYTSEDDISVWSTLTFNATAILY